MIANIAGGHLSIKWGFKGPNQTVTSACASANDAIGIAMRLILSNDADIMIHWWNRSKYYTTYNCWICQYERLFTKL